MIARIRTVKPSVLMHALLFDMGERLGYGALVCLSYIGLWCYTDREARFEWKPRELKMGIAPLYDVDFAHILNAFANAGLVVRYQHAGRIYGWIPRFLDHQNINGREHASVLPPPPADAVSLYESHLLRSQMGTFTREDLIAEPETVGVKLELAPRRARAQQPQDTSAAPPTRRKSRQRNEIDASRRVIDAMSSPPARHTPRREGNRIEGKGIEENTELLQPGAPNGARPSVGVLAHASTNGVAPPVEIVHDGARNVQALPALRGPRTALAVKDRMAAVFADVQAGARSRMKAEQVAKLNAEIVFLYWTARFDHPRAILDARREARILARLKENDGDVSELLYALDGAARSDHIMARGKYGGETKYDGIETVLRDRGQVEKFSAMRPRFRDGTPHKMLAQLAEIIATGGALTPTPEDG